MTSASNLNRSIYDCCDEDNPQCSPSKARVTEDGASPSALAALTQNTPVANLSAVGRPSRPAREDLLGALVFGKN